MRTLNLSGINAGDNLNISVSQNAVTAGPVTISSWGVGGGGGTISINVDRSHMQVAPDSVRFSVDLSDATFDTAGPTGNEVYDARLHDLIYLWDMDDDAGDWTAPVNVLSAWKDRNAAKGPFVAHMYTRPGTYNPSVLVIEPSTGKTATASLEVTVADPDAVYPGTNTICINPAGDGDWTGAPNGCIKVNSDTLLTSDTAWTSAFGGNAKRWLFKRGGDFTVQLWLATANVTRGAYFGAYGPAAEKPVIKPIQTTEPDAKKRAILATTGGYGSDDTSVAPDLRVSGLDFRGKYDPVTTRSDHDVENSDLIVGWIISSVNAVFSECDISGFQGPNIYCGGDQDVGAENTLHMDHCTMASFGGQYPIFGGQTNHVRSAYSFTGCRFAQTPGAVGSDIFRQGGSRAIIRANSPHRFHSRGCDYYHTDQWQHCIKVPETPSEQGVVVNVHSCSFEGGVGAMVINGNYSEAILGPNSHVHNVIIDGVAALATHSSSMPFSTLATGVTIRNSLVVVANANYVFDTTKAMIRIITRGTYDPDVVGAAPIRIYNTTFRNDRSTAQNTAFGNAWDMNLILYDEYGDPFTNIVETNNVIHQPNIDAPLMPFAPLSSTALWPVRDLGYRNTVPETIKTGPLASDWPDNTSRMFEYGLAYTYIPIDQGNFVGTNGKAKISTNSGHPPYYYEEKGDIEVTYGVSEITVKNTSGTTWGTGTDLFLYLDMGSTAPIATDSQPDPGSMKATRPLPGSAALGAALSGDVSYMDIMLQDRPEPPSMGAWEAE